jgi:hypothetical protein
MYFNKITILSGKWQSSTNLDIYLTPIFFFFFNNEALCPLFFILWY